RTCHQCTRLDPGTTLRPQTPQSFDCLDAVSPSRTYFDLHDPERRAINLLLDQVRPKVLAEDKAVEGFNVGMNCGEIAGQTIMHCHVHLIPRRPGDVDQPRGGVRAVTPERRRTDLRRSLFWPTTLSDDVQLIRELPRLQPDCAHEQSAALRQFWV